MDEKLNNDIHYWIYAIGENNPHWKDFSQNGIISIEWGEIGDLTQYKTRKDMQKAMKSAISPNHPYIFQSLVTWNFLHELKIGDIIFVKQGLHKVIARGIVESDYFFNSEIADNYKNSRKINWTHQEEKEYSKHPDTKTLKDISNYTEDIEKLNSLYEINDISNQDQDKVYPIYGKKYFLDDVFISEDKYETIINLLKRKKNIILQGAPGVGKTFAAKRIAYSILKAQDTSRVKLVQFHQSYSYEDFIMGYRPSEEDGKQFEKKAGVFYEFCKKAQDDSDNDYFFIIDEINRGNMSKIFGELLMLIEKDKRDESLQLLYSNEQFSIPSNLYIIGMMNTADRSLAIIDYALRRRFAFIDFDPAFDSDGFKKKQEAINKDNYNSLIDVIKGLNNHIENDSSLGKGFRIGHSYFVPSENEIVDDDWLKDIIKYEIEPLLEEYWFDNPDEIKTWTNKLLAAIK